MPLHHSTSTTIHEVRHHAGNRLSYANFHVDELEQLQITHYPASDLDMPSAHAAQGSRTKRDGSTENALGKHDREDDDEEAEEVVFSTLAFRPKKRIA